MHTSPSISTPKDSDDILPSGVATLAERGKEKMVELKRAFDVVLHKSVGEWVCSASGGIEAVRRKFFLTAFSDDNQPQRTPPSQQVTRSSSSQLLKTLKIRLPCVRR